MDLQNESQESSVQGTLTLADKVIPYSIVKGPVQNAIEVPVIDLADRNAVEAAARERLGALWYFRPELLEERLLRQFSVNIGPFQTQIYDYYGEFDTKEIDVMAQTLSRYCYSLKDPSLWRLESIQIRSCNKVNEKNGEDFLGVEYPKDKRFELFPASFAQKNYRNGLLQCSNLQGVMAHEITHVEYSLGLEKKWLAQKNALGWEEVEGYEIHLPGGHRTTWYNKDYLLLPSSYASLQIDDDIAESVVSFMFDKPKLNQPRTSIISSVMNSNPSQSDYTVERIEPSIPIPSHVSIYPIQGEVGRFQIKEQRHVHNSREQITLSDYRALRQTSSQL